MKCRYSIHIQWSDEDQAFLVFLPEFGKQPQTHGDTYEEATKNAQEVMELLTDTYREESWPLPKPLTYGTGEKTKRSKTRRVKSA